MEVDRPEVALDLVSNQLDLALTQSIDSFYDVQILVMEGGKRLFILQASLFN